MKSFCHVGPVVEGRDCFGGDLELATDFFEQVVGERGGVVTLEGTGESEVGGDVRIERVDDGCCGHVFGGEQPDETAEAVPTGEDVAVPVGLRTQFPEEVEVKDFQWLACPG